MRNRLVLTGIGKEMQTEFIIRLSSTAKAETCHFHRIFAVRKYVLYTVFQ